MICLTTIVTTDRGTMVGVKIDLLLQLTSSLVTPTFQIRTFQAKGTVGLRLHHLAQEIATLDRRPVDLPLPLDLMVIPYKVLTAKFLLFPPCLPKTARGLHVTLYQFNAPGNTKNATMTLLPRITSIAVYHETLTGHRL